MNSTETMHQMQQLRLTGMYHAYASQLEQPLHHQLEGHELIDHLIQSESDYRKQEKTAQLLKLAKFRLPATVAQVECGDGRNLSKQQLMVLSEGNYLKRGQNILITGATGCGKSYLACALGHQACLQGHRTNYLNMNRFMEKLTLARLDGSYLKLMNQLEKQQLIILDDFGLHQMNHDARLALLQILEDRYERKPMIITSQLPVANWYDYIQEPTLADAIMDRLTASCIKIELKGKSRRKQQSA
jgi:DNA replication protein DnaC